MFVKKDKYKNLYLDILKIGQVCLHTGLSYNKLKYKLEEKGYDLTNDCIELAIKQWFYDCFHHRGQEDKKYESIDDLEQHLDCNFILKGESCLKLIGYRTSWFSMMTARIALLISFGAFIIGAWNLGYKMQVDKHKVCTKCMKPATDKSRIDSKKVDLEMIDIYKCFKSYDTTYTIRHHYVDTLKQQY
ncbi:MAG: hypothetical protein JNJ58_06875 [Chitinophagaceae bacterium]|nr:hypothetical protein [Chitinophagaceae bacterium]